MFAWIAFVHCQIDICSFLLYFLLIVLNFCVLFLATIIVFLIISHVLGKVLLDYQDSVKRVAVGIWKCGSCGKVDLAPPPPHFASSFIPSHCVLVVIFGLFIT